jgi:hypothetical protein
MPGFAMLKAPTQLPPLSYMLDDLGSPKTEALAKYLGVSVRSVWAWRARDEAPRPAMLALFWETKWGLSMLDAELVNLSRWQGLHINSMAIENKLLKARVDFLNRGGRGGAANAPFYEASRPIQTRLIGVF